MTGEQQKVTIGNSIVLDFAGLFDETPPEAPESLTEPLLSGRVIGTPDSPKKPPEAIKTGYEGQQAKELYAKHQRAEEYHRRSLEVYKTYQENIKRSSQLQTEILNGIKAGESVYSLFLKASKAISLMTSNTLFYTQIEADTLAIYGEGLQQKEPLEFQLAGTRQRLENLKAALERELEYNNKERIKRAIRAHEARIAELEKQIKD